MIKKHYFFNMVHWKYKKKKNNKAHNKLNYKHNCVLNTNNIEERIWTIYLFIDLVFKISKEA